jgi:hypothetical protein
MDSNIAFAVHLFLKNNYYFVKKLLKNLVD